MDLEGEIAHALAEWHESDKPDEWIVDMYREAAAALSPLLNRVRAVAAAQALRALSDKYAGFTSDDPLQRLQFTSASAFMAAEAQAIEQNSEGNGDE